MSGLLHDSIVDQAERTPDAPAVQQDGDGVSYSQMERRANQLARMLRDQGCRRGDRVCVLSPVSADAIAAVLGAIKADVICVPLDATIARTQLAAIVEDCSPAYILIAGSTAMLVDDLAAAGLLNGARVGSLQRSSIAGHRFFTAFNLTDVQALSDRPVASRNRATNPAMLTFRSGHPSGVVGTHAGLTRSVSWAAGQFQIRTGDRLGIVDAWAGDRGLFAVLTGLTGGAAVVTSRPDPTRPRLRLDQVRRDALTHWFALGADLAVAAAGDLVPPADLPALRHVVCWADSIAPSVLPYWTRRVGHATFTSLYGAAEAATVSAHLTWRGEDARSGVPLGQTCPGHEILVLNDQLEPSNAEETGDLWIKGIGLSPGYWRNTAATADVFRAQGFGAGVRDRMWRTGDRGRRGRDGGLFLIREPRDEARPEPPIASPHPGVLASGTGV